LLIGGLVRNPVSAIFMSAKLTIVFFILICFEIGFLLVILPWVPTPHWGDNYLLEVASLKMHTPWLAAAVKSGFTRGAVTGLGLLNLLLGVWEIINFKATARAFQMEWQGEQAAGGSIAAVDLRDNGQETASGRRPAGSAD
jgi:hypothetical protein